VGDSEVGGDIAGLFALSDRLGAPSEALNDATDRLSRQVNVVVGDAGWSGNAAEEFRGAWTQDASAALGLALSMDQVSLTVKTLATALKRLDDELIEAQAKAVAAGVSLPQGPHAGPVRGIVPLAALSAANAYNATWARIMRDAAAARLTALSELRVEFDAIAPPTDSENRAELNGGDGVTLADIVRSLWASPAAFREVGERRISDLRAERVELRHVLKSPGAFSDAERALARVQARDSVSGERTLEERLVRFEDGAGGKWPLARAFRYSVADAGEDLAGVKAAAKFGGPVPVLGVIAAAGLTALQAKEDHDKGWSWSHAVVADGVANGAGLAAGTAAEIGTVTLFADAPPAVAATLGVAGGVLAGYGVGTYGYELTHAANWGSHITQDGVISGVAEGFSDAGSAWWHNDVTGLGDRVVISAGSVWNSVFG